MEPTMVTIQGRPFRPDIALIRKLLADNPGWGRTRLSVELCERWGWRNPNDQLRDMACRNLLLRLEKLGHIELPPRQRKSTNGYRNRSSEWVAHRSTPIEDSLKTLLPLQVACPGPGSRQDKLFRYLLATHHYLGYRNTVGENMKYLVHSRDGRALACVLFGAAAWKSAARDAFIGWCAPVRERNLRYLTNNTRFLILPWVKVPHLASHLLSRVARRVSGDWMAKYGHPLWCLETFVDRARYRGTCYRAANWRRVGHSTGRGRNDRHHRLVVPSKDIYLYPLARDFQHRLRHDA
jgi:Druantia protein DruA